MMPLLVLPLLPSLPYPEIVGKVAPTDSLAVLHGREHVGGAGERGGGEGE